MSSSRAFNTLKVMTFILVIGAVGGSAKAAVNAQDAVKARVDHFKTMGRAFKTIRDGMGNPALDSKMIAAQATIIRDTSTGIVSWFPAGSGPAPSVKTDAKPEIWSDAAGFGKAAQKLQAESAKLVTIANTGSADAIRAQVRATGGSCKGCHDTYRVPEKD